MHAHTSQSRQRTERAPSGLWLAIAWAMASTACAGNVGMSGLGEQDSAGDVSSLKDTASPGDTAAPKDTATAQDGGLIDTAAPDPADAGATASDTAAAADAGGTAVDGGAGAVDGGAATTDGGATGPNDGGGADGGGTATNPCMWMKCNDGNPCTTNACDPVTGKCVFAPLPAGTSCEDGEKCTLGDTCDGSDAAVCTPGKMDPKCAGDVACLVDGMGPAKQCPIDGWFCKLPAGLCAGVGTCTAQPEGCTKQYEPVCGCDGKTYGNPCMADAQGVAIQSTGACPLPPADGCCAKGEACKEGSVCLAGPFSAFKCMDTKILKEGQCWTDAQCPGTKCLGASACGCSAACKAMDMPGTCEKPNPCMYMKCGDGNPCTSDSCDPATGKCVFKPLPASTACDDGDKCTSGDHCDGLAEAKCVGGKVDPACSGPTTCLVGGMGPAKPCPIEGWFCKIPPAMCLGVGVCTKQPTACTEEYNPVCGCDGKTYGNACAADAAGVAIDVAGACPAVLPEGCCETDANCKDAQVCFAGPFNAFKCMDTKGLAAGQCWSDAQCGGGTCVGASACGCKAACKAMDKPGTCEKPNPCLTMKCGDGNPCTSDSCDPATGKCVFKPLAAGTLCDDGDKCTTGDVCQNQAGAAVCAGKPIPGCGGKFCSEGLGAPTIDCGPTGFCKLDVEFGCVGLGHCATKPGACQDVYAPVCGCNGKTYGNSCEAEAAGQNAESKGTCGGGVEPGCCKTDDQCKVGHCANGATGNGVCKTSDGLLKGQCWTSADCGVLGQCTGASVCPCKAMCFAPDKPGTCGAIK